MSFISESDVELSASKKSCFCTATKKSFKIKLFYINYKCIHTKLVTYFC